MSQKQRTGSDDDQNNDNKDEKSGGGSAMSDALARARRMKKMGSAFVKENVSTKKSETAATLREMKQQGGE